MARKDGLTAAEGMVMDALFDAHEAYQMLPVEHPIEPSEWIVALHRLQDLLAVRIVRRDYPEGWATFKDGEMVE